MSEFNYWEQCISEAFDEAGVTANEEQIVTVATWAEGAHDNYGMAHGHDCIPNPLTGEIEVLKTELRKEREKVICSECHGAGRIIMNGPSHSSDSECWKCRGEGRRAA